jgi:hypothetical protein
LGAQTGQGTAQQPRHLHLGVADLRRDRVLARSWKNRKTITLRSSSGSAAIS